MSVVITAAVTGSSPHARGALLLHISWQSDFGIIPACAGSTACLSAQYSALQDHPRMRGEHGAHTARRRTRTGSSPHARGAHDTVPKNFLLLGIIPACAGSTPRARTAGSRSGDHPRMRGEHTVSRPILCTETGSSPHARGALRGLFGHTLGRGIIPACAGSTMAETWRLRCRRDHPRMRGEHMLEQSRDSRCPGSSPHARGARRRRDSVRDDRGIIPACAGSTSPSRMGPSPGRDHPRMRGEHWMTRRRAVTSLGSSPHARGAPLTPTDAPVSTGIIPACAGSTLCLPF